MSTSAQTLYPRTLLLATDLQQSVLAELDRKGPNRFAYSPYGAQSGLHQARTSLGFNGQLKEHATGCYHLGNGYRVYNPVLMRFHSPDRFSPFGKGWINSYAYCGGSPINRSDPSGAWWTSVVGQIIGTLVGVLFTGAAMNRTANSIVSGSTSSLSTRLANILGFYGGVTAVAARPLGVPSALLAATPELLQGSAVTGNAVSQALTFSGGIILNVNMARATLASAQRKGQPMSRVFVETIKEVSGYNLLRGNPIGQVPHAAAVVPASTAPNVPSTTITMDALNIRGSDAPGKIRRSSI